MRQLSSLTLRMEPVGPVSAAGVELLSFRAAKQIRFGDAQRLTVQFDLFNAFNANDATAITRRSGRELRPDHRHSPAARRPRRPELLVLGIRGQGVVMRKLTFVAIGLLAAAVRHHARRRGRRTRPEPQGPGAERARQLPVKLHPHDIDDTFIQMPLAAGDEKYGRLEGGRMKQFVGEITAISVQSKNDGELMWGRIAGTKYDDMVRGAGRAQVQGVGSPGRQAPVTSTCRRSGSRPAGRSAPAAAARR